MSNQEKTLRSMAERAGSFCPGSFGIAEFSGSSSFALFTEKCVYPIAHMSLNIVDQNGTVLIHGTELPPGYRLLLDDHGEDPARARLALTQGTKKIITVSGDLSPIQGSVLVIADVGETEPSAYAISAVFGIEDNRQMSSILWDMSNELIRHWALQSKLLGKGDLPYASKQHQPQPGSSEEYDETYNMLQCFQNA